MPTISRRRGAMMLAVAFAATVLCATPAIGALRSAGPDGVRLDGYRARLERQTRLLVAFTGRFRADGARYYALARAAGFDYARLWATRRQDVSRLLTRMKRDWVAGNPLYERMEGIVAGTPALARYDVIIDAGGSGAEDPASAVPFDLALPDGRVLRKPGNFYNITEAALWGTDPAFRARATRTLRTDLDGDGRVGFGEVLPDAAFMLAATRDFDRSARALRRSARAYRPTASDAFTALVVMVPTMSEYFGQWKDSRFVAGSRSKATAFNVVSRLSDINDIIGSLQVIYRDVQATVAASSPPGAAQIRRELDGLATFIRRLHARERSGRRFTPQQAELLGSQAQDRATAIAGQVTQSAARLNVDIKA
jgi:hypothetical protein